MSLFKFKFRDTKTIHSYRNSLNNSNIMGSGKDIQNRSKSFGVNKLNRSYLKNGYVENFNI